MWGLLKINPLTLPVKNTDGYKKNLPDWNQVISRCLVYWENEEKLHQLKYES